MPATPKQERLRTVVRALSGAIDALAPEVAPDQHYYDYTMSQQSDLRNTVKWLEQARVVLGSVLAEILLKDYVHE